MKEQLRNAGIIIVLLVLAAAGAIGYSYFNGQKSIIDNPLTAEIKVQIDSAEYNVPANSQLEVKVPYGEHEVKLDGQNVGKFTNTFDFKKSIFNLVKFNFQKSIINPTESEYVLSYEIYTTSSSATNNHEDKFVFDLYIPATWDYGLTEDYPTEVTVSSRRGSGSKTIIKEKIFRIEDYVKHYGLEEEYKKALEEAMAEELQNLETTEEVVETTETQE